MTAFDIVMAGCALFFAFAAITFFLRGDGYRAEAQYNRELADKYWNLAHDTMFAFILTEALLIVPDCLSKLRMAFNVHSTTVDEWMSMNRLPSFEQKCSIIDFLKVEVTKLVEDNKVVVFEDLH